MSVLSHEQARSFYDRFGARQDSQAFYEDPATEDLVAHAAFDTAVTVFEFGCGTGRFAEQLLATYLPQTASYVGIDVSTTMAALARQRIARFGERARVHLTDGNPTIDREIAPDLSCDRFVSNFVLDLLSPDDIHTVIAEAHRLLVPNGLLCLSGLGHGTTLLSRLVSGTWKTVHSAFPRLVGGCRPVEILEFVQEPTWKTLHNKVVTPYCISSEIVVAEKQAA